MHRSPYHLPRVSTQLCHLIQSFPIASLSKPVVSQRPRCTPSVQSWKPLSRKEPLTKNDRLMCTRFSIKTRSQLHGTTLLVSALTACCARALSLTLSARRSLLICSEHTKKTSWAAHSKSIKSAFLSRIASLSLPYSSKLSLTQHEPKRSLWISVMRTYSRWWWTSSRVRTIIMDHSGHRYPRHRKAERVMVYSTWVRARKVSWTKLRSRPRSALRDRCSCSTALHQRLIWGSKCPRLLQNKW